MMSLAEASLWAVVKKGSICLNYSPMPTCLYLW